MIDYELSVLYDTRTDYNRADDIVRSLISEFGGVITKIEDDGVKRLAYSICGQDYAHYTFYDVRLPQGTPAKLSSKLNITDEVLRYLLVRVENRRQQNVPISLQYTSGVSNNNLNGSF